MPYKLRCTLVGHEADVRAVAPALFPAGGVLTASRDQSARLWIPENGGFVQSNIFCGHTRYVASVCTMPPSDSYPQGLVITGGHDNLILGYDLNSTEPIWKLEGHTGAVCSLDAGKFGTILSGSWDKTAKVWINGKVVMNFNDHEAAVWAVKMLPDKGLMLTGSADKTIKLWKAGKCERTYIGHKDCVRCVAILTDEEFLSCSNDGTIRRWILSGDCIQIYEGHTNFVYSIAVIPGLTDLFVSSGEDRSVKVWKDGKCEQTIMMPCQSIWSVTLLNNGDIVAGSSDSIARVFTADESKFASVEEMKEFEECVSNQAIPAAANLDLGDIKVDQLSGPEALLVPGTHNEQTKLIKRNGVVEAHQWDINEGKWQKVGEVTGAAGEEGSKRVEGKETYEGKPYDYVFNIDIKEGAPPLKLPFNITDDPWLAAQKFLDKHEISQMFLDQVANFIIKNTESITIGAPSTGYSDPYTGGGRYVPGSTSNSSTASSDPFTGQGRYVPPSNDVRNQPMEVLPSENGTGSSSSTVAQHRYFPEKNYLKFVTGKSNQIISKLKEFNDLIDSEFRLSNDELQIVNDVVCDLLRNSSHSSPETFKSLSNIIMKFSKWPHEKLVPVLDVLRLIVLDEKLSLCIFDNSHGDDRGHNFVNNLVSIAQQLEPIPNILLVFRIGTNSFLSSDSALVVYEHRKDILDCCEVLFNKSHKNLSVAISSLLVNFSVYCVKMNYGLDDRVLLCTFYHTFLGLSLDEEAYFRLLIALGTLLDGNDSAIKYAISLETHSLLKTVMSGFQVSKTKECAEQVEKLFIA